MFARDRFLSVSDRNEKRETLRMSDEVVEPSRSNIENNANDNITCTL